MDSSLHCNDSGGAEESHFASDLGGLGVRAKRSGKMTDVGDTESGIADPQDFCYFWSQK